jgi:hypothetical protein
MGEIPIDGYVISAPDIREPFILVRYVEALLREARAEVLASVLAVFDERKAVCDLDEELKQWGTFTAIFRHRIAELQPTASALEALRREAEVDGIRWAEGHDLAQTTARIAELRRKP